MCRTFNNGIGMVLVLDAAAADACAKTLADLGEQVYRIGVIADKGDGQAVVIS
jgi:phosphoribosylformylglycinamidine cyclo-ligase